MKHPKPHNILKTNLVRKLSNWFVNNWSLFSQNIRDLRKYSERLNGWCFVEWLIALSRTIQERVCSFVLPRMFALLHWENDVPLSKLLSLHKTSPSSSQLQTHRSSCKVSSCDLLERIDFDHEVRTSEHYLMMALFVPIFLSCQVQRLNLGIKNLFVLLSWQKISSDEVEMHDSSVSIPSTLQPILSHHFSSTFC